MAGDRLTAEAVERIISATGLDDAAAGIDRDRLAKDLELNRDLCLDGAALKPAAAKRDKANLERIVKNARKSASDDGFLPPQVKSALMALIAATDRALEKLLKPADRYRDVFKNRSTFELLVGFGLARIYEAHFGRNAGFSRGAAEASGPCIRFADQALIELNVTNKGKLYTREAIARALALAKAGHVRNQG